MEKKETSRTLHAYELELRRMIAGRTGKPCEPWAFPQIRSTAANMKLLDKLQEELTGGALVTLSTGSMGQVKNEVNPLLPYYDKLQRTLLAQFEALGLNYNTTPSKVTDSTKAGGGEADRLAALLADAAGA